METPRSSPQRGIRCRLSMRPGKANHMASRLVYSMSVLFLSNALCVPAFGQVSISVTGATSHNGAARIAAEREADKLTAAETTITMTAAAPANYTNVSIGFGLAPSIDQPTVAPGTAKPVIIPVEALDRDITVSLTATGAKLKPLFETAKVHVDSKSPLPLSPVIERFPGGSGTVRIPFDGNDLDPRSVVPDAFHVIAEVQHDDGTSGFSSAFAEGTPIVVTGNTSVVLNFRNLNPGNYWIVIDKLKDVAGNGMIPRANAFDPKTETAAHMPFTVPGGSLRGEQVEYPRFLQPKNDEKEFDPGDRVDTKVVQLYYFRDARQIAEYINRNIQDLNQQGYDEAQRFAQQARQQADQSVDERRFQETQAVESARKTREVQRQLDQTKESLDVANQQKSALTTQKAQLENAIQVTSGANAAQLDATIMATESAITAKSTEINTSLARITELKGELEKAKDDERNGVPGAPGTKATVQTNLDSEQANQAMLVDARAQLQNKLIATKSLQAQYTVNAAAITQVESKVTAASADLAPGMLPKQLADGQVKEIDDRSKVVRAEATELRAAQEQFRREVAAGMADRNSYAKGKLESIDPVTQVTVSVVGTSRIQLRGPIKGINKIGRMIHQLDTPVGQVKIGIHTIQVNGEHGDRMDFVYERINQEVAHSRFLVNTSSQLLRRAVQEVASEVAMAADQGYLPDGCPPDLTVGIATLNGTVQTTAEQRERRYVYAFFGSDFIGELEEMDSEFLNSENKLLSLHSMDTISLAGALFAMAHADNPVRQRIVQRFQEFIACELPQRETEYIQALTHVTSHGKSLQNRFRKAMKIDSRNASEIYFNASRTYHFPNTVSYFNDQVPGQGTLNPIQYATVKLAQSLKAQLVAEMELKNYVIERSLLEKKEGETEDVYRKSLQVAKANTDRVGAATDAIARTVSGLLVTAAAAGQEKANALTDKVLTRADRAAARNIFEAMTDAADTPEVTAAILRTAINKSHEEKNDFVDSVWAAAVGRVGADNAFADAHPTWQKIEDHISTEAKKSETELGKQFQLLYLRIHDLGEAQQAEARAEKDVAKKEEELFSKRLLDQFIDEQEEKSVELMEALRSHSSNVDNYLKRLAIAVEDDVAAQFYEPAFQRIRRVSRTYDVTLGQIETTTVLTNNRTLAKVSPAASFEFDLPQRDILLTEALNGSKALANEYGNLLKDGTFLAGTAMLSGQPPVGIVGSNAPIQGIPGMQQNAEFGSELQKLIPDPAIYKFETGTGFEIQPIIQPDGNSIVYGFDYMYSTNVREPVRADEKHLGRIKRHFVHTDVQTSSYELREISRYTVALKASRTDRGVPLFEDLPGIGAAFRPLPSDESSLQTNIILGSSTIYPTVFDLMGLRWSAYVDELSSPGIASEKDKQSSRREDVRSHLLNNTRKKVNDRIGLSPPAYPRVDTIGPGYAPLPDSGNSQ